MSIAFDKNLAQQTLLELHDVDIGYLPQQPVARIDAWHIRPGEIWALCGDNGTGKTSLVRTLVGLQPALSGQITQAPRIRMAYVAQNQAVANDAPVRVWDRLAGGIEQGWSFLRPVPSAGQQAKIYALAEKFELTKLLQAPYQHLSQGQKQRVDMARALLAHPQVLVLDEPSSGMDFTRERAAFAALAHRVHTEQLALVMVAHHLPALWQVATHWAVLLGDGQTMRHGTKDQMAQDPKFRARYQHLLSEVVSSSDGP